MDENTKLEKLNKFTRREHTADEVYIFDAVLCDNEVDRDGERFSLSALNRMKELFVGKTGISDHNAKSSGQTARIFDTFLETSDSVITSAGEPYTRLKAGAYMVRTKANEDLISEIDGGIKKEVSVSCSAERKLCSVCGTDISKKKCAHIKGKMYGEKKAHVILDGVTDAYEWSFVAVPAQINAGVTKKYSGRGTDPEYSEKTEELNQKLCSIIKGDVVKLCFLNGSAACSKALAESVEKMSAEELMDFKKSLEKEYSAKVRPQLGVYDESLESFKMQEGNK